MRRTAAVVVAFVAALSVAQVPMYSDYPWGLVQNGTDQGPVYNLNCIPPLQCSSPTYGNGRIQLGDGGVLNIGVAYALDAGLADLAASARFALDAGNIICSRCIIGDRLGLGAVGNLELGDLAVTEGKLGALAVTEGKLGALAVTEGKLGAAAVTNTKLADLAVSTGKLQDLAVSTGKLNNLAVTESKLGALSVTEGKLGALSVTEGKIGALAVTNGKIGALAVDSAKLASAAVTTAKIATGAVTANELGAAAVTTAKIATGAVTANEIGSGAVTEAKIGTGAVTNTRLGDLSVSSGKLASAAVTSAKIAAGAVNSAAIGTNAVTTTAISNLNVTASKLDDGISLQAYDEEGPAAIADRASATNASEGTYAGEGYVRFTTTGTGVNLTSQVTTGLYTGTSTSLLTTKAVVRYRISGGWTAGGNVTFTAVNTGNTAETASFAISTDGNWHTAVADISGWTTAGTLRIDVNGKPNGASYNDLSYIATGNPGSGTGALVSYRGNVGVGTATPGAKLDVSGTARASGDFAPNTTAWQNAAFRGQGSYGGGLALVDGAAGFGLWTDSFGANLNIGQGATSGGLATILTMNSGGKVGVGTASPAELLHVSGGNIRNSALAGVGNRAVYSDANGTLTNTVSDATLKTAVEDLRSPLRMVLALRPVSFGWRDTGRFGQQREIGLLAQEVMQVIPEVVGKNSDGTYTVDYPKIVAALAGAVQELYDDRTWLARRVQALEDRAQQAEDKLAALEARLAALEHAAKDAGQ